MPKVKIAKGQIGYILKSVFSKDPPVFRQYSEDKQSFKDYEITHYDLKVKITDQDACFYEDSDHHFIDYSERCLTTKNLMSRPALGEEGFLMRVVTIEDAENGTNHPVIRQYTSADKRKFKDYLILHYDLGVEIIDNAQMIEPEGDECGYIDYPYSRKAKCAAEENQEDEGPAEAD